MFNKVTLKYDGRGAHLSFLFVLRARVTRVIAYAILASRQALATYPRPSYIVGTYDILLDSIISSSRKPLNIASDHEYAFTFIQFNGDQTVRYQT